MKPEPKLDEIVEIRGKYRPDFGGSILTLETVHFLSGLSVKRKLLNSLVPFSFGASAAR